MGFNSAFKGLIGYIGWFMNVDMNVGGDFLGI